MSGFDEATFITEPVEIGAPLSEAKMLGALEEIFDSVVMTPPTIQFASEAHMRWFCERHPDMCKDIDRD